METFPPVEGLVAEGEWWSSVGCAAVAVDEMLLSSDGRRGCGCELDDDSDGSWKRMVS